MEIRHSVVWKHFESGAPQGHENLFVCKCVFVRALHFSICVCPVFGARWAQGHQRCHRCPSFSHPSQKNMLIQTNLLFLLLRLSSPPTSPQHSSWDGLEETCVHHPQPGCLISFPYFFFFPLSSTFFIYQSSIIPSLGWLQWETMRKPVNRKRLKRACFARRSFLPRGKRRLPGGTTVVSTHGGGSRQKSFIWLLPRVLHGML